MILDTSQTEHRFFHSFPRPHPNESMEAVLQRGLAILTLIKRIGLVLAPEVLSWNIPLVTSKLRTFRHCQIRVCFTQLAESDLKAHAEVFGPFSLSFSVDALRLLGAMPVIYIPQALEQDSYLSSIGPVIAWMFEMARYTFDQLHTLKQYSDPAEALRLGKVQDVRAVSIDSNYVVNLNSINPDGSVVKTFTVEASVLRSILDYLNYETAPFDKLSGAIQAAQTLFYPTDDLKSNSQLSYYRQREWRIVPGMQTEGTSQVRPTTAEEKEELLAIDSAFWLRELQGDKKTFRRIDESCVLVGFDGKLIQDAITEVLVPASISQKAREIFGDRVREVA